MDEAATVDDADVKDVPVAGSFFITFLEEVASCADCIEEFSSPATFFLTSPGEWGITGTFFFFLVSAPLFRLLLLARGIFDDEAAVDGDSDRNVQSSTAISATDFRFIFFPTFLTTGDPSSVVAFPAIVGLSSRLLGIGFGYIFKLLLFRLFSFQVHQPSVYSYPLLTFVSCSRLPLGNARYFCTDR